jgi:hypothetical protein
MALTNREWATLFWVVVLAAVILWKPSGRASVASIVTTLLHPKLLVPLGLFALWMTGVVAVGARLGLWEPEMLKDTLLWAFPGIALVFASVKAGSERAFFRRRVREAVGLTVLLEFYLNFATLDLIPEILLQAGLFLAVGVSAFASREEGARQAKQAADVLLGILVLVMLVPPAVQLASEWQTLDAAQTAKDIALPVWMTIGALPFIYVLTVYSAYEQAFMHMSFANDHKLPPWRARITLMAAFHGRYGEVERFAGKWPWELVHAKGWRASWQVIRDQRASLRAEKAAKRQAADDLVRYSGVQGLDGRGRQLDKREFKETVKALETLANAHMGWYRNHRSRYQPDILTRFPDAYARDLPHDHGITMAVSRSGQSWYAWRRTPSGLYLAIGAAGPPPDQWFYEGMKPPSGFPKVNPDWTLAPFERGPNWEWVDDPNHEWTLDPEADAR